ncbi:MAG: hypothetical protein UY90_C0022G0013 [Candidatus Peregrinibacteria bacterium GW2011_GWA2_54_9]|nr:MAG: hypothetical protein UY90_C0022G0013 [Candidatus Peregrinibacteria bacterium GW2011_GWA2_54_9]
MILCVVPWWRECSRERKTKNPPCVRRAGYRENSTASAPPHGGSGRCGGCAEEMHEKAVFIMQDTAILRNGKKPNEKSGVEQSIRGAHISGLRSTPVAASARLILEREADLESFEEDRIQATSLRTPARIMRTYAYLTVCQVSFRQTPAPALSPAPHAGAADRSACGHRSSPPHSSQWCDPGSRRVHRGAQSSYAGTSCRGTWQSAAG